MPVENIESIKENTDPVEYLTDWEPRFAVLDQLI